MQTATRASSSHPGHANATWPHHEVETEAGNEYTNAKGAGTSSGYALQLAETGDRGKVGRIMPKNLLYDRSPPYTSCHEELWLHILGFLDFRDLLRISETSRGFRTVATNEQLWEQLYDYYFSSVVNSESPLNRRNVRTRVEPLNLPRFVANSNSTNTLLPFISAWVRTRPTATDSNDSDLDLRPSYRSVSAQESFYSSQQQSTALHRFKLEYKKHGEYIERLREERRRLIAIRKKLPFCICCNVVGDVQQYCLNPMAFFCGLPLSLFLLCGKLNNDDAYSWVLVLLPALLTATFMILGFSQAMLIYYVGRNRQRDSIEGALWVNESESLCGRYVQKLLRHQSSDRSLFIKLSTHGVLFITLLLGVLLLVLRIEGVLDAPWSQVLIPFYLAILFTPATYLTSPRRAVPPIVCLSTFLTVPLTLSIMFSGLSFDGVLDWNAWQYLMPLVVSLGILWILFLIAITAYTIGELDEDRPWRAFCLIWLPSMTCFTFIWGLPALQLVLLILKSDTSALDDFNYFEILSPTLVLTSIFCCGCWPGCCLNGIYHCAHSEALWEEGNKSRVYRAIDEELEGITVGS